MQLLDGHDGAVPPRVRSNLLAPSVASSFSPPSGARRVRVRADSHRAFRRPPTNSLSPGLIPCSIWQGIDAKRSGFTEKIIVGQREGRFVESKFPIVSRHIRERAGETSSQWTSRPARSERQSVTTQTTCTAHVSGLNRAAQTYRVRIAIRIRRAGILRARSSVG